MKANFPKRIFSLILTAVFLLSLPAGGLAEDTARMDAAQAFVDTVLEYGRYIEGSTYPELFVMGLNTDTMEPVEWRSGNKTYYPANFFSQQNFLRTLVGLTNLTGNPEYKEIAKKQMQLWLSELTDKNGLIYTGAHTFVDVRTGAVVTTGDHEMKNNTPYYELMYEVDPEATIRYMEAFWNAHILDWTNLSMNRHGTYDKEMSALWDSEYTDTSIDFKQDGVAFQSTGNDLIAFALFIAGKTGDKEPEEWALRLLQKYIDVADDDTGLSGAQYGELETGDRTYLQFKGSEWEDIAREYNYVDANDIATTAGYAPQVLLPYYESLSDEEKGKKKYILDYVVKNIEGVATYAYDAENHRLKTPMWSNGEDFGGYVLQNNGYHGNAGDTVRDYEELDGPLLSSAIYAYKLSGSETIWQFARSLAAGYDMGDIGTAPGENVDLKLDTTTARSGDFIGVMIDLYRLTNVQDYLDLAEKMGENILTKETRNNNMFLKTSSRFNAKLGDGNALTLLQLEAALQGKFDIIPEGGPTGGIDMYYDGVGRIGSDGIIFHKTRTSAESISLDRDAVTIPLTGSVTFTDISGHSNEKEIKQMASLGAVDGREGNAFKPDENITCGEFIAYCSSLCGAEEAELTDSNMPDASENITKEEMASVLVKALAYKNPQNEYTACGALSQFADSADIASWASDYVDIAANYCLLNNRGDDNFLPKATVTRGEAAAALKKLSELWDIGAEELSCSILPAEATTRTLTYTSSNPDVVEVDENGRLFPISVGSATISASCGSLSDSCSVSIVPCEAWMLKSIEIDGKAIDNFSPMQKDYSAELLIGTTEVPSVSAVSCSGEEVNVILPKRLPGVAKLCVKGESENSYLVTLLPDKIDFVANESFDTFPVGTIPHSVVTDKTMWYLHSNGWENGYAPVKIAEHPTKTGEGNNVVAIPYKGRTTEFSARFHNTPYITGDKADDGSIVVEYDLMTSAALSGLEVRLIDYDTETNSGTRAVQLSYTADSITISGGGNPVIGTYTPGVVHTVKMVIDKKTLKTDVYFNGEKTLSAQAPMNVTGEVDTLRFRAGADLEAADGTMVYVDNIKIYELPADTQTYVFYDTDGNKLTRIGDESNVSFQSEISASAASDGETADVISAVCSADGTLKQIKKTEATVGAEISQLLKTTVNVNDMQKGDYLCIYVWTKELKPLLVQSFIYKC